MKVFISGLVAIYFVGYMACLYSWFFSAESREYIRTGQVRTYDIITGSFNWMFILYDAIRDCYNNPTN
jgi:TRAP-type uncharacterized transport system fused permease subunit